MKYVLLAARTRKVLWLLCLVGCSGKSLLVDLLSLDSSFGVCRLGIDYNRSFKYNAALDIEFFMKTHGCEPKCFIIDAPRNDEAFFLHEIYSCLEELSNGRVDASFSGRRIRFYISRNIPIIVFANSPPLLAALSEDRWDLKCIFQIGSDFLLQNARSTPIIVDTSAKLITWQNLVETLPIVFDSSSILSELDQMLLDMYNKHCDSSRSVLADTFSSISDSTSIGGCLKITSSEQTMDLHRLPVTIRRAYQLYSKSMEKKFS